ncbi:amino acid transporter AVT1J-like [Magnolia sinica]|uniref:amino acid transporter AVT1J-like n=1 Tax=Magnolia sinica TaxID=86752 RepID=UPI002657EE0D|nr:amino acid transporter AVT1J-like [Magnolia sinica]
MAILGYLMYGQDVKSQVTLNLPIGKISSKIAIYTTLINPLAKYALIITPVTEAIEDRFHIPNNRTIILIRTLLVISTVIVALTILLFGYLMALIGSFLSSMVKIVFPSICYLKICKASCMVPPSRQLEFVIIVGILVIGVSVTIICTYNSLRQIVQHSGC